MSFKKHLVYYLLPRGDFHTAHHAAERAPLLLSFYGKADFQCAETSPECTKMLPPRAPSKPQEKPPKFPSLKPSGDTCGVFLVSPNATRNIPAA